MRHELFEELDACNPRWATAFRSLTHAAHHYGLVDNLADFLGTPEGVTYLRRFGSLRDYVAENAVRAAQIDAERSLASRLDAVAVEDLLAEVVK